MTLLRLPLVRIAAVLVLAASACAPGEPGPGPTASATASESPGASPSPDPGAAGITCTSPRGGYELTYPEGWHSNNPEEGPACRWFHPSAFELPRDTEVTHLAVSVGVDAVEYRRAVEGTTGGPTVKEVLSRSEEQVAGKEALRVETVASGEGLYPEGTRSTIWLADWGEGRTLLASTTDLAEGEYRDNQEVLAGIVASIAQVTPEATCSAAALSSEAAAQEGLPQAVAQMRQRIVEAAVACDLAGLAALAGEGSRPFSFTFGGADDPAAYWSQLESENPDSGPMLFLAGILKRSYGTTSLEGETLYVWPAAHTYEGWAQVPEEKRRELEPLYRPIDLSRFEQFGSYAGYRVGITESGEWLYFVAGD